MTHPGAPSRSGAEPASGARVLWLWLSFSHKTVPFILNSAISASNAYQWLHGTTTHYGAQICLCVPAALLPRITLPPVVTTVRAPAVVMQTLEKYTKAFA